MTAILIVNNLRDIDTDRRVGKKTLAVHPGPNAAPASSTPACVGVAYAVAIGVGLAGMVGTWWWLPLLSLPLAIWLVRFVEPDRRPTPESGAQADGSVAPALRAAVRGGLWLG